MNSFNDRMNAVTLSDTDDVWRRAYLIQDNGFVRDVPNRDIELTWVLSGAQERIWPYAHYTVINKECRCYEPGSSAHYFKNFYYVSHYSSITAMPLHCNLGHAV